MGAMGSFDSGMVMRGVIGIVSIIIGCVFMLIVGSSIERIGSEFEDAAVFVESKERYSRVYLEIAQLTGTTATDKHLYSIHEEENYAGGAGVKVKKDGKGVQTAARFDAAAITAAGTGPFNLRNELGTLVGTITAANAALADQDVGTSTTNKWVPVDSVYAPYKQMNRLVASIYPILIIIGFFGIGLSQIVNINGSAGGLGNNIMYIISTVIFIVVVFLLLPMIFEKVADVARPYVNGQYDVVGFLKPVIKIIAGFVPLIILLGFMALFAAPIWSGTTSLRQRISSASGGGGMGAMMGRG